MKRAAVLILILFLVITTELWSFELGASFLIENLAFTRNRSRGETDFSGLEFPIGFSLYGSHQLQDNLFLEVEYVYDDILRNITSSLFIYQGDFYSFGVGPFVGFLNSSRILPKVGISSLFKIEWPGRLFAELWIDSSTNNQLTEVGHYSQERNRFSFGFYVPGAICALNWDSRSFAEKTDSYQITDTLNRYSFSTDIFKKNVPYKIVVTFALQGISKSYDGKEEIKIHTLNSLVLGTRVDLDVTDFLTVIIDLDSSIYSYGQDELLGVSNPGPLGGYLFRALAGVRIDMDRILRASGPDESPESPEL